MNWEEYFNQIFPSERSRKILASQEGLFRTGYNGDYTGTLEDFAKNGDLESVMLHLPRLRTEFEHYQKAWKAYKRYPGKKTTLPVGNCWSDCNLHFRAGILQFPVPGRVNMAKWFLKASRLLRDAEKIAMKHPKHKAARL
jgi:hypothetical protein